MFNVPSPMYTQNAMIAQMQHPQSGPPMVNPMMAPQTTSPQASNPMAQMQGAGMQALLKRMQPQVAAPGANPLAGSGTPAQAPIASAAPAALVPVGADAGASTAGALPGAAAAGSSMWPSWLTSMFAGGGTGAAAGL